MDKIAKKPYLNYHSSPSESYEHHHAKRHYRGRPNDEQQSQQPAVANRTAQQQQDDDAIADDTNTRPKGVPSRLRLLTIDMPNFKRDAFDAKRGSLCQMPREIFDTDQPTYVDGVAPSKPMSETTGGHTRSRRGSSSRASRRPIVQKSLAKQLYYCYERNTTTNHPGTDDTMDLSESQSSSSNTAEEKEEGPSSSSSTQQQQKQPPPRIGVEILEASIMALNPNNIRRTYTSSPGSHWKKRSYKYDPGKYTEAKNKDGDDGDDGDDDDGTGETGVADVEEEDEFEAEEALEKKLRAHQTRLIEHDDEDDYDNSNNNDEYSKEIDIDDPDYERNSPRNQYAWLEELHLRINGIVPFGAPMQKAPLLSRWFYGRTYRQEIPMSSPRGGWVSWLWLPVMFSGSHAIGSRRYWSSWSGVDGGGENGLYGDEDDYCARRGYYMPWWRSSKKKGELNRASNKPHAVICNGAAMQRVPGSLRYLTKICRDAQIPLYILNDTRSWGSQTHSNLSEAIVDMRKTVSNNIIQNALELREGSAFERGRFVGQLEKEMAWQAYDAARKTREALMDARSKLQRERKMVVEDWGELNEEQLLEKLVERKVVVAVGEEGSEGSEEHSVKCTEAFTEVCRQCLETRSKNEATASQKK